MSILERLLSQNGRAAKTSDRQQDVLSESETDQRAPQPDMLPAAQERDGSVSTCSVLVEVTGSELDTELIGLACSLAKEKNVDVHAIYGIEVPRSLPVNADVPKFNNEAEGVLKRAAKIAARRGVTIAQESIQSRNFGQSLVSAASTYACSLLILGLPYSEGMDGQFALTETVDYALKNAPCRVWVVRGQRPATAGKSAERAQREPANAS